MHGQHLPNLVNIKVHEGQNQLQDSFIQSGMYFNGFETWILTEVVISTMWSFQLISSVKLIEILFSFYQHVELSYQR